MTAVCPAWCTDHEDPDPDDPVHMHVTTRKLGAAPGLSFGDASMMLCRTDDLDGTPTWPATISVCADDLTARQAREVAAALLELADLADGTTTG